MRTRNATAVEAPPPAKPRGGYRLIGAAVLAAGWWAYREKLIRLVDLRVWFAAHEMDARRCRVGDGVPRRFHRDELGKLAGLSARRVKDALRRLGSAGLLGWSDSVLVFPDSADALPFREPVAFRAFFDLIPNRDRKVPVPRRVLRLLAGGARPALIATVLAHLLRGLYRKGGACHSRGRVKASWIAATFGVSLRRVKHARRELIAAGWLIPLDAEQWALNRWGAHFRINLDWSRLDALVPGEPVPGSRFPGNHSGAGGSRGTIPAQAVPGEPSLDPRFPGNHLPQAVPGEPLRPCDGSGPCPELAPPPAGSGRDLAPPESDREPLIGRGKNQKPAPGGPAGVLNHEPPTRTPCRPELRDVHPRDLKDTGRLLVLFAQAIALGWVSASERDRLRFVAAAEHARSIGTRNPCGLFVRLVRCGLWTFLTQDDEDAARVRLRRHLFGSPDALPSSAITSASVRASPPLPRVGLSEDARIVGGVRAAVASSGYRGDPFPLVRRGRPEWSRERWDAASAEWDQAARGQPPAAGF